MGKKGIKKEKNIEKTEKKITIKELDELWSKVVRQTTKLCPMCLLEGKKEPRIFAHHIFSRRFMSTRFNLRNGIGLCYKHHIHVAHSDYETFRDFIVNYLPEGIFEELKIESKKIKKWTQEELKQIKENLNGTI